MTGHSRFRRFLSPGTAALLVLGVLACKKEEPPKPCCEQPEIPEGTTFFKVVADETKGPPHDQTVKLKAVVPGEVSRNDLFPPLHTLYRHAMTRGEFPPRAITVELYENATAAKAGANILARLERPWGSVGPTCTNSVPYSFHERAQSAFRQIFKRQKPENKADTCRMAPDEGNKEKAIDDAFAHQPAMKVDAETKHVAVSYPYLRMGEDTYIENLRYSTALRAWLDYMMEFFEKLPELDRLTFVGIHDDEEVLHISTTRQQFKNHLSGLQEDILSSVTSTIEMAAKNPLNAEAGAKQQEKRYKEIFQEALKSLPADQVKIDRRLK